MLLSQMSQLRNTAPIFFFVFLMCVCVYIYIYIYIYIYACMHVIRNVFMCMSYVWEYVCMYIFTAVYACVYICLCMWEKEVNKENQIDSYHYDDSIFLSEFHFAKSKSTLDKRNFPL